MKKFFAPLIRELSDGYIAATLPQFAGSSLKKQPIGMGGEFRIERIYSFDPAEDLRLFVLLTYGKFNSFNFEVGWSRNGELPPDKGFDCLEWIRGKSAPIDMPDCLRTPLGLLHSRSGTGYSPVPRQRDYARDINGNMDEAFGRYWAYGELTLGDVEPWVHCRLRDAADNLCRYAVPYFNRVVRAFGEDSYVRHSATDFGTAFVVTGSELDADGSVAYGVVTEGLIDRRTRFSHIYYHTGSYKEHPLRTAGRPIDIEVHRIRRWLKTEVPGIESGMPGWLWLSGLGTDEVRPGRVLFADRTLCDNDRGEVHGLDSV